MQSKAKTVKEYLAELPEDRRKAIEAIRKVILANMDKDLEEGMQYGMIGYFIPHRVYPPGYHCDPKQPLGYICLGSQKNYMSLYIGPIYGHEETAKWFKESWAKTGKKLDMGKSCVRFKKLDDLPLDLIAQAVRRVPVRAYLDFYENVVRKNMGRHKANAEKARKSKPAAKTSERSTSKKVLSK
jgi:hypothetical protein